jgi:hypothetical protein
MRVTNKSMTAALPDGAMIVAAGRPLLCMPGKPYRWTNDGRAPPERLHRADGLLTPPSTLMICRPPQADIRTDLRHLRTEQGACRTIQSIWPA